MISFTMAEVEVPVWSILVPLLLTFLYMYSTWTYNTFKKLGIPGPKPWPLLGNAEVIRGFDKFCWKLKLHYGNVVGVYFGRKPVIVLHDRKIIKRVLIKDFDSFTDRAHFASFINFVPPLEKALLGLKGTMWKKVRRLMTPAFSSGKLRQMMPQVNARADILVENLAQLTETPIELLNHASAFSLDVISRVAFGLETNAQENLNDAVYINVRNLSHIRLIQFIMTFLMGDLVTFLRIRFGIRLFLGKTMDFFTRLTSHLVEGRHANQQGTKDFFQLLLDAHRKQKNGGYETDETGVTFSNSELTAHTVQFYLGGTDTTGKTLTFLCHSLAFNPEVQNRLIKDIDNVIGDSKDVTSDMCAQIPYLRQCICETLRLYPPFRALVRECTRTIDMEGIHFPAGVTVRIPIAVLHMDPDCWQEPQKFRPERFSPEEQATHDPAMWLPFGIGPRNCIGMRLAMMEVEIAAVKLLQMFRILPCAGSEEEIQLRDMIVTEPAKPVLLQVQKRC